MNDLDKAGGLSTFNKKGIFLILSRKQNKKKLCIFQKALSFAAKKEQKQNKNLLGLSWNPCQSEKALKLFIPKVKRLMNKLSTLSGVNLHVTQCR